MDWKDQDVLVTGAGGFIGSHLVERLCHLGARVTALVRYNSMNDWHLLCELPREMLAGVRVLEGDVRDPHFVARACRGVQVVFHLAATISIPQSYATPTDFVETNVRGTANLLSAVMESGCRRMICTSTSEVYGTAVTTPMNEDHPLSPQSPYAASKAGADLLALSYVHSFGAPVAILRPFNAYGPRQSARAIIPAILSQLAEGDTVRAGDVTTRRDFTYVADTVEGFIAAASVDGAVGKVVNLGSGADVSIQDLIGMAGRIAGREPVIVREEARVRPGKSEVRLLRADATRAHTLLGWRPRTPLDRGLKKTLDYIRGHLPRYRPGEYLA